MYRGLKILAIVVLIATILGAGVVFYGINTLVPDVVQVTTLVTPAQQAQDTFDSILESYANGILAGKTYADVLSLTPQQCSFVTYTVRLHNQGFFPAEWISLHVQPLEMGSARDVLELDNGGANVLPAGAQGDLSVTLLTTMEQARQPRMIEISCYVFGRKQTVSVQAN